MPISAKNQTGTLWITRAGKSSRFALEQKSPEAVAENRMFQPGLKAENGRLPALRIGIDRVAPPGPVERLEQPLDGAPEGDGEDHENRQRHQPDCQRLDGHKAAGWNFSQHDSEPRGCQCTDDAGA